jgi:hypothetical protein
LDTSNHSPDGGTPLLLLTSPPLPSNKTVAVPPTHRITIAGSVTAESPTKTGLPAETDVPGTAGKGPVVEPPWEYVGFAFAGIYLPRVLVFL